MRPKAALTTAHSVSRVLVASPVALMFSVYLDTPRAAPCSKNFALIDDDRRLVDKSIWATPPLVCVGYMVVLTGA